MAKVRHRFPFTTRFLPPLIKEFLPLIDPLRLPSRRRSQDLGKSLPNVFKLSARSPAAHLVAPVRPQHLHDNIRSLEIKLTPEQIAKIDSVQEFEHGFPSNFCGTDPTLNPIEGQPRNRLIAASGTLDFLPGPKPFGLA